MAIVSNSNPKTRQRCPQSVDRLLAKQLPWGYRVQGGLNHETNGHSARALACRRFDGYYASRGRRRTGAVLALQRAQSRTAVPAQQAGRVGLGFRRLLDRMRFLLCLGAGWLP